MKHTKIFFALVVVVFVACGDTNERYVRKAVKIMDRQGLYAQGEQWEAAKAEALVALKAHTVSHEEAVEIVQKALKVAGGKHSFILSADEVADNDTGTWAMPSVELRNSIAIIKLPAFSGNDTDGRRYAATVLEALPDRLKGAIIDLRDNRGDNMYPMIAAVHRFLPDDDILRFRSRKGTQPISCDYVMRSMGMERQAPIECPVAILTNEWTASSGEAVLICFRGLENVRVFGSPTAGYASANTPFPLPDGSKLVLTTGCDVARTGEEFCDDPIVPDISTDTPMEDALSWIGYNCRAEDAIDYYLIKEIGSLYAPGEVCIPHSDFLVADSTFTTFWGSWWVFNYNIVGDTLKTVSGGNHAGKMQVRMTDNGYKVVSFDQVEDGSRYRSSAKRIFGDIYNDFRIGYIESRQSWRDSIRMKYVGYYVEDHHLPVTMLQDYGWPAVEIPIFESIP